MKFDEVTDAELSKSKSLNGTNDGLITTRQREILGRLKEK